MVKQQLWVIAKTFYRWKKHEKLSLVIHALKLIQFSNLIIFYFYSEFMQILQTRLYSLKINSKRLSKFSNTKFYRNQMKEDFMSENFILHPIVTTNYCMLVLFHNPIHLTFLINKYEFTMGS